MSPRLGRCPGGGHGNPLQYSGLVSPMDRGAWQAAAHGVTKSQTRLKRLSTKCSAVIDGRFRSVQLLGWRSGKEPGCQCRRHKRHGFNPWVRKIPWRRKWQPTPEFLPGKSRGQRSLVGYSPWGHTESDLTEQAHVHALGMLRVLLPLASALLFSCSVVSNSLQPYKLQHARLPCPSPSFGACTNSGPLSW